jgi:thymidylate synthase
MTTLLQQTFAVPIDVAWPNTYHAINTYGTVCAPRGKRIRELPHQTVIVDLSYPVLRCPARGLNYRFLAAEASWICRGSNRLADLTPYNPRMAEFSDDGETLAGAYGPRVLHQLPYVVRTLLQDRDTRQAALTLWTPCPRPSKDVPCTIALDFKIRDNRLNVHAFMRSSDAWLGLPYDVFSFTSVGLLVLETYNHHRHRCAAQTGEALPAVRPGTLYLTAASMHLYEEHWDKVIEPVTTACPALPLDALDTHGVVNWLEHLKDTQRGDPARWWEREADGWAVA